jgi:DNA-binding protein H-NS
MAETNGMLTDKQVSAWFEGLSFNRQVSLLDSLSTSNSKIRNARIAELHRELAALYGNNSRTNGATKRGKQSKVQAKYRDPATGDTWSGRGRMSTWVAAKVKASEKASRYLAK